MEKELKPKKEFTDEMLGIVQEYGTDKAIDFYDKIKNDDKYFSYKKAQLNETGYELFKLNKVKEGVAIFKFAQQIFSEKTFNSPIEQQFNDIGYHFLGSNKILDAIELFKFNTELYPSSWNVYDSLGEAYALNGEIKLAIENYKKSLGINPENQYGIDALKRLEGN